MIINPSTLTNGVLVIPNDDVNIPGPALQFSGTANGNVVNKLIDTTRPIQVNPSIGGFTQTLQNSPNQNQVAFGGQGVQIGDVVYNTTANTVGIVGAVDSDTTLSIINPDGSGANLDLFPNGNEPYAIYQANGSPFNNGDSFGFRALVGAGLLRSSNASAGYTNATNQAIVASGGTIFDIMNQTGGTPLTFTMTTVGGEASSLLVATAGKFSASSLVGRTVIFDQAAMRNVTAFGNTGTLGATFTFEAADENFTDRIQASGQPKSFQIYNGDTTESDFNLLTSGGDTVQLLNVQPGALIPLAVIRVWAVGTDTTAGTIIALT
tara:strand:+ start:784 stop:1749 length:966 start_codon:yes stop_codon:yes gene_type:complete